MVVVVFLFKSDDNSLSEEKIITYHYGWKIAKTLRLFNEKHFLNPVVYRI